MGAWVKIWGLGFLWSRVLGSRAQGLGVGSRAPLPAVWALTS